MTDWLHEAGEAAMTGTAIKQAELTNLTFTIKSLKLHQFTDQKGNPGESYIATIRVDGQGEDVEAWLGGVRVMAQVKAIIDRQALPIRVKQTTIEKAYNLEAVGAAKQTATVKDKLAAYMNENSLKAADVLTALGSPPDGDIRQAWSDYMEKVTTLNGVDEDGACELILNTLKETKPKAEIPF